MALIYETGELIWMSSDPQQGLRYIVGVHEDPDTRIVFTLTD